MLRHQLRYRRGKQAARWRGGGQVGNNNTGRDVCFLFSYVRAGVCMPWSFVVWVLERNKYVWTLYLIYKDNEV